jgi:hypothetical protein
MRYVSSLVAIACVVTVAFAAPAHAVTNPLALCHKTVVKQLEKYKKTVFKKHQKCLEKENKLTIPGPCPDALTNLKIGEIQQKVIDKIAVKCTMQNLADLGFRSDCQYGTPTAGVDGQCAALPVTTVQEFVQCMQCWKEADFLRYVGILFASHAAEECGTLGPDSTTCSDLGCTTPLPEQRNLGDNAENDCQKAIGNSGIKYLLKRENIFEKCMLKGCDRATCLAGTCVANPTAPLKLQKAEVQKETVIKNKCGNNRVPNATSTFCCRCGPMGGICTEVPLTREDCLADSSCQVQEGKNCNTGNGKCEPAPKQITWWESCPSEGGTCPGTALTDLDGVIACIDSTADQIVDELLCLQFPNGGACPTPVPTPVPTATP